MLPSAPAGRVVRPDAAAESEHADAFGRVHEVVGRQPASPAVPADRRSGRPSARIARPQAQGIRPGTARRKASARSSRSGPSVARASTANSSCWLRGAARIRSRTRCRRASGPLRAGDQAAQPGASPDGGSGRRCRCGPTCHPARGCRRRSRRADQRFKDHHVADAVGHVPLLRQAQERLKASTIRGQQGWPGSGQSSGVRRRLSAAPRPGPLPTAAQPAQRPHRRRPGVPRVPARSGARADDHGLACQPGGAKRPPWCPATAQQLPAAGDEQPRDRQVGNQVAGELVARASRHSWPRPGAAARPSAARAAP